MGSPGFADEQIETLTLRSHVEVSKETTKKGASFKKCVFFCFGPKLGHMIFQF